MDFMVGKGTPHEDDEEEVLDFTDGAPRRMGSGERSVVTTLKNLVHGVHDGSKTRKDLETYIHHVADALRKAIAQCAVEARNYPARAEYFKHSSEAYKDCLGAVTTMLEVDSVEVLQSLMGVFRSAANKLDALLAEEEALEAQSSSQH